MNLQNKSKNFQNLKINNHHSYLLDIFIHFVEKKELLVQEINWGGSRASAKTRTAITCLGTLLFLALQNNLKIHIRCFRKYNKNVNDLSEEFIGILGQYDWLDILKFTKGGGYRHRFEFPKKHRNQSYIEIRGVYSNSREDVPLKGLANSIGADLIVIFLEEANEFTKKEKQAIEFGVRGDSTTPILTITACNPESIHQYHIAYLNKNLKFNLKELQTQYFQFLIKEEFGIKKIFHYANWRKNQYLPKDTEAKLLTLEKYDPIKATTWSYGMIGNVEESVFSRELPFTKNILDFSPYYFSGGIDIGASDAIGAHPTAGIFTLWSKNRDRVHIEREFYRDNRSYIYNDRNTVIRELVEFFVECSRDFNINHFTIYVDYGGAGNYAISMLENERIRLNYHHFQFVAVNKSKMLIIPRVDATKRYMNYNLISFNWNNCKQLYKDMDLMRYKVPDDNSIQKVEILDKYDDLWDAMMYSLLEWSNLLDDANNTYRHLKYGKKYT